MTFDSVEMRAIGRFAERRLVYALLTSLVVHLLILWPDATRMLTKEAPTSLSATLKPLPPAVSVRPPELPSRPIVSPPAYPLPAPAMPLRQPGLEQPAPALVPPATSVQFEQMPPSVASPVPSVTAPVREPGSVALTEAGATGEVLAGLRSYRLLVAAQARRFKRYPAQAMASGWEGVADILVEVGSDGRPHVAVIRSSGHESLDRAALTMIDAGTQQARLPEDLRGKAFTVVLPVVFSLDDR